MAFLVPVSGRRQLTSVRNTHFNGQSELPLWESIERNQFVTAFYGILTLLNKTLFLFKRRPQSSFLINAEGKRVSLSVAVNLLGMFLRYSVPRVLPIV
jgi:hypothetical protein